MKALHLLRHAKSSWDSPTLHDHDRPLAPRGLRACETMAAYLREESIRPDVVLCSTAARTRATLSGVLAGLGHPEPPVRFEAAIYEASAPTLMGMVSALPEEAGSAMLIGHQPGIGDLASRLAGSGERLDDLERKFPTGALATLTIESSWAEAEEGSALLAAFVRPKELERR